MKTLILIMIYSMCVGILPVVVWGYTFDTIEWWLIAMPLNIIGNSIIIHTTGD